MLTKFNNFLIERTDVSKSREITIYADDILSRYLSKIKKLIENNEQLNIDEQDQKFNWIDYKDYTVCFLKNHSPGEINFENKTICVDNKLRFIIDSIKNKDKKEALNIYFDEILNYHPTIYNKHSSFCFYLHKTYATSIIAYVS